jgi:prephenate dehydrogenase
MGDTGGSNMKIVVIGGSGLIGKKVVADLRQRGHSADECPYLIDEAGALLHRVSFLFR